MAEVNLTRIKSIYAEITGYYNNLPSGKKNGLDYTVDVEIGNTYNALIDKLSELTQTDYSYNKIDLSKVMYRHLDYKVVKMKMGSAVSRLEVDYGFGAQSSTSQPAIAIFNTNQNKIDININFTLDTLIEAASNPEEKANLGTIKEELQKPNADWEKLKIALMWVVNYSKELSLKVLPILLDYYLKHGS